MFECLTPSTKKVQLQKNYENENENENRTLGLLGGRHRRPRLCGRRPGKLDQALRLLPWKRGKRRHQSGQKSRGQRPHRRQIPSVLHRRTNVQASQRRVEGQKRQRKDEGFRWGAFRGRDQSPGSARSRIEEVISLMPGTACASPTHGGPLND